MLALAALYIVAYYAQMSSYPFDDAYIHMRIARNFAETGLPHYNPGEAVMVSSAHLWITLLSLLFLVFGASETPVIVTSLLLTLGCMLALTRLLGECYGPLASAALAALVVVTFLVPVSASLMETPLAMLLLLLAMILWRSDRATAAGLCIGLAMLTRYEMVVFAGMLFLLSSDRRAFVLGFTGPATLFLGFCLFYFQTIVPNPMVAKKLIHTINPIFKCFEFTFPHLAQENIALGYEEALKVSQARGVPFWLYTIFLPFVCLGLALRLAWRHRKVRLALLLIVPPVVIWGIHITLNTYIFAWYYPLMLLPLTLAFLLLARQERWIAALPLIFLWANFYLAGRDAISLFRGDVTHLKHYAENRRIETYREIGRTLASARPDGTLYTAEIGAVGWTYPGRVLDAFGLASPGVLPYHPLPVPEERISPLMPGMPSGPLVDFEPDFIVALPAFSVGLRRHLEAPGLGHYSFVGSYEIFERGKGTFIGDNEILVYRRMDRLGYGG